MLWLRGSSQYCKGVPTNETPRTRAARRGDAGDARGSSPAASDHPHQSEVPEPRRTFADTFAPEAEPDWLRRRRITRQAVSLEQWRHVLPEEGQPEGPERSVQIVLSISDVALAALPLVIGLILLFLGFGPGQVTFQT